MSATAPADADLRTRLVLRPARPDDAEALAAMMGAAGFRNGTAQLPFVSSARVRRRLEADDSNDTRIVATLDAAVVGSAELRRLSGRRAHVGQVGMGVADGWTGRRIGTALMEALVDVADNWLGLRRLELEVLADNEPALALYGRFGFLPEGLRRDALFRAGAHADTLAMARLRR